MGEGASLSLFELCVNFQHCRSGSIDFQLGAGRKDLFTVLDMQHPGKPSDDAWMGNAMVDPARGKAHAPGPEERSGRSGLFDLMQHKILLQAQRGAGKQVLQCSPISMVQLPVLMKAARVLEHPCQG